MESQVTGHGPLQQEGVPLRRLHAAEGGRGAAEPGVPQAGIVVVELPPAGAPGELAGEVVVQIALMGHLVDAAVLAQPGVVQAPADVVVAPEVVQEQKVLGQAAENLLLPPQ